MNHHHPSPRHKHRFIVLDSFRGLCALSVVVFHLHLLQGFSEWDFFRSAGLMVEFFFTLSGFVLAYRYMLEPMDGAGFGRYMISRFFRIYPLHLVMLLLFSVSMFWQWASGEFAPWQLQQWLYQILLLQAWLPAGDPFAFNGPAWSISVEFYLYVLFGAILWVTLRWRQAAFVLLVAGCSLCVWLSFNFTGSGGFRGITCFFLGALAYRCFDAIHHWRLSFKLATLIEVLLLAALYMVITAQYPNKSFLAAWAFAIAIIVFAFEQGAVSKCLRHESFVSMGKWSFSIYLSHYGVLHLILLVLTAFAPQWLLYKDGLRFINLGSAWADNLVGIVILALVLLISRWSYQVIELRGIRWGKQLLAA
ncbi:acyltransferase [Deefgea tanakiae]|uniref:Acyltransferase n=1 Tax=Deefgea tanakiae TaxID=2865840 RepID=A0ABX8Z5U6_9NEIS|nr:acyltransferase [Deefgea tanakiae]QZA77943.1 acyltransferase [Deefgea tanakiae]